MVQTRVKINLPFPNSFCIILTLVEDLGNIMDYENTEVCVVLKDGEFDKVTKRLFSDYYVIFVMEPDTLILVPRVFKSLDTAKKDVHENVLNCTSVETYNTRTYNGFEVKLNLQMYHEHTQGVTKMNKKFWAVWRESGGAAPNKRHETKESALTEASRLAQQSSPNERYYVLEVIGVVEPVKIPVNFTEIME